ncbi:polyphosphate kinase 2 family protein [Bdellovibrio sp. ZAP7]|uniref:PPK2 family polyphosphate kinase n=1 Tax=Bdellovibrio sp. ZAP7 TaxID=2231053 RepID=UPI0011589795|nr:PPK2 family polyphosphate kinase [Bdellovibrio sp. ZAP7]QDK45051.1 polyphosphate kinase 2 family protein [Bdellovibrio sp. ZAP7]
MIKEKHFYPTSKNLAKVSTIEAKEVSKKALKSEFELISEKLGRLQELIFAESKHKVLIILQGLDTSGKDGTVKHVFAAINPQGLRVVSFKRPTDIEVRHDYLWRIHKQTPERGEMVIFNRSHYEDLIVPLVHKTLPLKQVKERISDVNAFEKMLVREGVTILKFFLHISRKEQASRLRERIDDPEKHWKFELSDLAERRHWHDYQKAYGEVIQETHHTDRPWFIVPGDDKNLRNLIISSILLERLEKLNPVLPAFDQKTLAKIKKELKHI